MIRVLEDKRQAIAEASARFGVARLDAFGSALRDDFRPGRSDVDLLVEFHPMDPFALVDACFWTPIAAVASFARRWSVGSSPSARPSAPCHDVPLLRSERELLLTSMEQEGDGD